MEENSNIYNKNKNMCLDHNKRLKNICIQCPGNQPICNYCYLEGGKHSRHLAKLIDKIDVEHMTKNLDNNHLLIKRSIQNKELIIGDYEEVSKQIEEKMKEQIKVIEDLFNHFILLKQGLLNELNNNYIKNVEYIKIMIKDLSTEIEKLQLILNKKNDPEEIAQCYQHSLDLEKKDNYYMDKLNAIKTLKVKPNHEEIDSIKEFLNNCMVLIKERIKLRTDLNQSTYENNDEQILDHIEEMLTIPPNL